MYGMRGEKQGEKDHKETKWDQKTGTPMKTAVKQPGFSSCGRGTEKGTGYFANSFDGRPRRLNVDSKPNAAAVAARHSSPPNGCCRFTHVRSFVSSCSKSGWSIHCGTQEQEKGTG